jgi:hypothetical protein
LAECEGGKFWRAAQFDALHDHETEMIAYGFRAHLAHLIAMQQAMPDNRLDRIRGRSCRVADPTFKRAMFVRAGSDDILKLYYN